MEPVVKKLTGKAHVLAPGDILTEQYISRKKREDDFEALLAVRSLLYIQLLEKEEMIPSRSGKTPHRVYDKNIGMLARSIFLRYNLLVYKLTD
jgi:hypothetical protein